MEHRSQGIKTNRDGRKGDHAAFECRREKFELSMAIWVFVICGLCDGFHHDQRNNSGNHIDDALDGIGEYALGIRHGIGPRPLPQVGSH